MNEQALGQFILGILLPCIPPIGAAVLVLTFAVFVLFAIRNGLLKGLDQ